MDNTLQQGDRLGPSPVPVAELTSKIDKWVAAYMELSQLSNAIALLEKTSAEAKVAAVKMDKGVARFYQRDDVTPQARESLKAQLSMLQKLSWENVGKINHIKSVLFTNLDRATEALAVIATDDLNAAREHFIAVSARRPASEE